MKLQYALCDGEQQTITADAGMSSYLWSTGATTRSIAVSTAGIYTLAVTKQYANGVTCAASFSVEVKNSKAPVIANIIISDRTARRKFK